MIEFPELPECLRVENRASWAKGTGPVLQPKPDRRRRAAVRYDLPKTMTAEAWELLKAIEKTKADKLKAKFKALREKKRAKR